MLEQIRQLAHFHNASLIEWRHFFHSIPELSFEEIETTENIHRILQSIGISDIHRGVAGKKTGIIADIKGKNPGKCVALRADIDALPLEEENDLPYRSKKPGVMHACGHDGHITILLGVALLVHLLRHTFCGTIRFIFQPSEEASTSGAKAMIREGVLEGVDRIAGLHLWQSIPSGQVGYNSGPLMASCDKFTVRINGRGGHGGSPHLAIDPVIPAAALVGNLQTIISRKISPLEPAVLSIGKIVAGTASNIIPDFALLEGTIRTFSNDTRNLIRDQLSRISEHTAEAYSCKSEVEYIPGYPATINNPDFTDAFVRIAKEILGDNNVYATDPVMGSDDMSFFLEKIPGVYFFLGTGNARKNLVYPHHHPKFNIDDDVLSLGTSLLTYLALQFLETP